jgi:GntR family transcriptional regulator / MocR family aminotransferase
MYSATNSTLDGTINRMSKNASAFFLPAIALDRRSSTPLYKQLYEAIRQDILRGALKKRLRLPSTRYFAAELNVSRNIVVIAFEQLLAEGYLQSKTGAGTFVADTLPEEVLQVQNQSVNGDRSLSDRGRIIKKMARSIPVADPRLRYAPFRFGLPALAALPLENWGRLLLENYRKASPEIGVPSNPAGHMRLREAIASYVGVARGVRCQVEQVIIINGSQQAIDLATRVLADPGDYAVIEDPGYLGARSALEAAGIRLLPGKVGKEGLLVGRLPKKQSKVRLVYVTPSHQFPLGVVLSLPNRLQLLDWAAHHDAWILEDDFDSEFRYESKPIPALQGLDQNGRVIYMGTFSKVLFPSLRLGYLIVPEDLVDAFVAARWISDRSSPLVEQAALADFITQGHLASHIRRMRALYMERRSVLMRVIREEMSDILETWDSEAGMHTVGWLPPGIADTRISEEAARSGLNTLPVSSFALRHLSRGGLLLGYAAFPPEVLRRSMRDLGSVIRKYIRHARRSG